MCKLVRFYIPLVMFFCFFTFVGNAQYLSQRNAQLGANATTTFTSMVDNNTVWTTQYGTKNFSISVNSGITWTVVTGTGLPIDGQVTSLYAMTATKAYITYQKYSNSGVYITTDGANTWTRQDTAAFDSTNFSSFPDFIHFFDENNGVVVGDCDNAVGSLEIYTTSNGGTNWNRVPLQNLPLAIIGETISNGEFESYGTKMWFVTNGANPRVFKSDYGISWTASYTNMTNNIWKGITFSDENNGLLYNHGDLGSYSLYKTNDGGVSFTPLTTIGLPAANDIEYIPETTSVAAVYGTSFYFSNDGGNNWTQRPSTGTGLSKISFKNRWVGYADSYNSTIYKFYNTISLIGSSLGTAWTTDVDMYENSYTNTYEIYDLKIPPGEVKFRLNHSSSANSLSWGNTDFPVGVSIVDGPNIPVLGNVYDVHFNPFIGNYSFTKKGFLVEPFLDVNGDHIKQNTEPNFTFGNIGYQINNGVTHNVNSLDSFFIPESDSSNLYDFNYEVNPQYQSYYSVSVPPYQNITTSNNASGYIAFPIQTTTPYPDISVVISSSARRVNSSNVHYITITNHGNGVANGNLEYLKNPLVTLSSFSGAGFSGTLTETGFTGTYSNLLPLQSMSIKIQEYVPPIGTVSIGQQLTSSVSVATIETDPNLTNNNFTISETVMASLDPNEKSESHGPQILFSEFTNNDYLYYTIRFQNDGNAVAFYAEISDALDAKLDKNTLSMLGSSHNYVLDRTDNDLVWVFNDIFLMPSSANLDQSQGYVQFKIKPLPGYAVGDVIPNFANIIFDSNPAIVTDPCTTTFVSTLGIQDLQSKYLKIYPNPANDRLNIEITNSSYIETISIYDHLGRKVLDKNELPLTSASYIDVNVLSEGIYTVNITASNQSEISAKIIIH